MLPGELSNSARVCACSATPVIKKKKKKKKLGSKCVVREPRQHWLSGELSRVKVTFLP